MSEALANFTLQPCSCSLEGGGGSFRHITGLLGMGQTATRVLRQHLQGGAAPNQDNIFFFLLPLLEALSNFHYLTYMKHPQMPEALGDSRRE